MNPNKIVTREYFLIPCKTIFCFLFVSDVVESLNNGVLFAEAA